MIYVHLYEHYMSISHMAVSGYGTEAVEAVENFQRGN